MTNSKFLVSDGGGSGSNYGLVERQSERYGEGTRRQLYDEASSI